jgi:hypothetical protein
MLFATVGQGALFIWMAVAGMAVGVWYGMTALLRRILQAGFWLTLTCDLLFGLGSAVILLCFMITGNYGQVRLFSILGAGLGFSLFMFALAAPMTCLLDRLQNSFRRFMTKLSQNRLINVIFR